MTPPGDLWFVDTNVLLYRHDSRNAAKQRSARIWIEALENSRSGRLSWQVINEFYDNAVRKIGAPVFLARRVATLYTAWHPVSFSLGLLERSWYWSDRAQFHYWDALILASAEVAGCRWLLSEDFQTGRRFGDVTVVNPFESDPKEFGG